VEKIMGPEQWTVAIAVVALFVAIVAAAAAVNSANQATRSAEVAERQLALVERKIGMVTDPGKMTEILPIWYIHRMATDDWGFGLLMRSGSILAIRRIEGVSDDGQWLKVSLSLKDGEPDAIHGHQVLYRAVDDRDTASVRVDQVQAAFETRTS
jgi:hypothetical protein